MTKIEGGYEFPWGNPEPGEYKVGDEVGLFYSDHDHYVFDNPTGVVKDIDLDIDGTVLSITVGEIEASVQPSMLYLITREGKFAGPKKV